jgi:hypothetical protein
MKDVMANGPWFDPDFSCALPSPCGKPILDASKQGQILPTDCE